MSRPAALVPVCAALLALLLVGAPGASADGTPGSPFDVFTGSVSASLDGPGSSAAAPDGSTMVLFDERDDFTNDGTLFFSRLGTSGVAGTPVQISAAGVNPFSPAAAIAPNKTATVVWTQGVGSNTVQMARVNADDTIPSRAQISGGTGNSFEPQVAAAPDGGAVATWLQYDDTAHRHTMVARIAPGGTVAGPVVDLGTYAMESYGARVAVGPDGVATVTWAQQTATYPGPTAPVVRAARVDADGTVLSTTDITDTSEQAQVTAVAVDADGVSTIAWQRGLDGGFRIQTARLSAAGVAGAVSTLSDGSGNTEPPRIAMGSDGAATVVWNQSNGTLGAFAARISASGTPSAAARVSPAGEAVQGLDVGTGAGLTTVAWLGSSSRLIQAVQLAADGTAGTLRTFSAAGDRDYEAALAVGPNGFATISWTRGNDFNSTLRAAQIVPLVVSPSPGDFGNRGRDAGPTAAKTFTLTPVGTDPVTVTGVAFTGANTADYAITANTCTAGTEITTAGTCTVDVTFDPSANGTRTANLVFATAAGSVTTALTGNGTIPELTVVQPAFVDFGKRDIDAGASSTGRYFQFYNSGTDPITLTDVQFSGRTGDFVHLTGETSDCVAGMVLTPGNLSANQGCFVRIEFAPTTVGAKSAVVTIVSNAPSKFAQMFGTGTQTQIAPDSASLDAGSQDIDDAGVETSTTIRNTGTETVTLAGVAMGGTNPTQFTPQSGQPSDCVAGKAIVKNGTCTLRVVFDPSTVGAKSATVTLTSNADPIAIDTAGTGTQTSLSPNVTSLDFGSRDVDDGPTAIQSSTVRNSGTEPVTLTGVDMVGADATQFQRQSGAAGDCAIGMQLNANDTCTVRVRFDPSPTATNARSASVKISSNAPDATVALAGFGAQTELSRAPATLAFGPRDVDAGATAIQSSTISNSGTEPVTLGQIAVGGTDSGQFVPATGQTGDCATGLNLTAGQTCTVRIAFDPSTGGAKSATVTVPSNAADVVVALTGTGTKLRSSAASLAFGSQDIDDGPAEASATFTNLGADAVTIGGVAMGGTDTALFTPQSGRASDCAAGASIAANASCTLRVRFDPASVGDRSATVTVTSSAEPIELTMTGKGTQTLLTPGAATLDFGSRDIDEGSTATRESVVRNTGTEAVTLGSPEIAGADPTQFALRTGAAGDCAKDLVLAAGDTCTVRVAFDPSQMWARTATVKLPSTAPDAAIALTGFGAQTELSRGPAGLDFGSRDVDAGPGSALQSTVTNTGTEPVTLQSAALGGAGASEFELLGGDASDCDQHSTLVAGATCVLRLRFDPSGSGARSATVSLASSAATVTVDLAGTGTVTPPKPTPQPAPLPSARLLSTALAMDRKGAMPIRVQCLSTPAACVGTLTVRTAKPVRLSGARKAVVKLASGAVNLPARGKATTALTAKGSIRDLVQRLGTLKVVVTVALSSRVGALRNDVSLVLTARR